jgi:hypothetical protein
MSPIHPLAAAHALARWTRHDAHRFLRPDWRRYVQPASELARLSEQIERKYRPDQPRVPAGVAEGGQWTGTLDPSSESGEVQDLSARAKGHHHIAKAVYEKLPLQPETKKVFSEATTGPLADPKSNYYDRAHRDYNDAVRQELNKFMNEKGVSPEQMTPDQAREFVIRILESRNPTIETLRNRMILRDAVRRFSRPRAGE